MADGDYGGNEGGFGGLGIGNPGSYGGDPSVGAPGFDRGYSDIGGYSVVDRFADQAWDKIKSNLPKITSTLSMMVTGNIAVGAAVGLITKLVGNADIAADLVNQAKTGDVLPEQAGTYLESAVRSSPQGMSVRDAATLYAESVLDPSTIGTVEGQAHIDQLVNQYNDPWADRVHQGSWVERVNAGIDSLVNPSPPSDFLGGGQQQPFFSSGPNGLSSLGQSLSGQGSADVTSENTSTDDRAMWDDFMDMYFGVPPYESQAAQRDFQTYFQNAKPGDTQEWAGGTLTMGANGVALYITPEGETVKMTADTSLEEIYNTHPGVQEVFDATYATGSIEDIVNEHAAWVRQQAEQYNQTQQDALDTFTGTTNDLTSRLDTATANQNNLIDTFTQQGINGTGYYSPVSFGLGNQNISFVPRTNRDTVDQITKLGQTSLGNTQDFVNTAGTNAQSIYDNTNTTSGNILNTAQATSPQAGNLAYLGTLTGLLPMEETRRQNDADNVYRNNALAQGLTISNNQLQANEPGMLDYAQAGNLLFGEGGIFGSGGVFGNLFN